MKLTSSTHETRNQPQFARTCNRGARKPPRVYVQTRNRSDALQWPELRLPRRAHNAGRLRDRQARRRHQALCIVFVLYTLLSIWLLINHETPGTMLVAAGGAAFFGGLLLHSAYKVWKASGR